MDMNGLNQSDYLKSQVKKSERSQVSDLKEAGGRTIGSPKLSEKALKYYEQLKKKYSNMDFILVSPDKKEEAERNKGMYASNKELLVLIDSDKIEQMAEDEEFRKKYETILANATAQMTQMKNNLGPNASKVSSFGMTFDDNGNASLFAVVDKSLALQRERITEKREENAKAKKQEDKKAAVKKAEKGSKAKESDKVMVTASSWEELLKKIDDVIMSGIADNMLTDEERTIGQKIDYLL